MSKNIVKRLKFDKKSSNHIIKLIQWHDERIKADKKLIKEILFQLGEEAFLDLLKVQLADSRAQNPDYIKEKENSWNLFMKYIKR